MKSRSFPTPLAAAALAILGQACLQVVATSPPSAVAPETGTETEKESEPPALASLAYPSGGVSGAVGVAISPVVPAITGGLIASCEVDPALPSGLVLSSATCAVSGTPGVPLDPAAQYAVTARFKSGGSAVATLSIRILPLPPSSIAYSRPRAIYLRGSAITANVPTVSGGAGTFSVSPPLPQGLQLNPTTGVITGNPSATTAEADYVVTVANSAGEASTTLKLRTGRGFQVTTLQDASDPLDNGACTINGFVHLCSLRGALEEATYLGGSEPQLILVPAGTITVSAGDILFTANVEIIGAGMTSTILDGAGLYRALDGTALETFVLSDLTIQNGKATYPGGGGFRLKPDGASAIRARLERVKFTQNVAGSPTDNCSAGGLLFQGNPGSAIEIVDSVFDANTVHRGIGSAFRIDGTGTTGEVLRTWIVNNVGASSTGGGAVAAASGSAVTVRDSLIRANTSEGRAAAISVGQGSHATFVNTTITENTSLYHGSIFNGTGGATFIHSTIAHNHSGLSGYGAEILISTNDDNTNTLVFANTVLFDNVGSGKDLDCGGTVLGHQVISLGGNLADTGAANCFGGDATAQLNLTDLGLGAIGDHGGPLPTIPLLTGSPAIDAANPASCEAADARGLPRAASSCDSGAFERQ